MRRFQTLSIAIVFALSATVSAQQVWTTTPLVNVSDSFYENFGVNWGVNLGGFGGGGGGNGNGGSQSGAFFNMGNNSTPPPFGGYDPAADATFGFRAGPFSFRLRAGQGSNRSITTQAPSVMLPNGGTGFFASVTQRPFVTGLEPVVNGIITGRFRPRRGPSVLRERWNRMQYLKKYEPWKLEDPKEEEAKKPVEKLSPVIGTEDEPLVLIGDSKKETPRRSESSAKKPAAPTKPSATHGAELRRLLNRARSLESRGKYFYARLYYEQAERKAQTPQLKSLLRGRIKSLLERTDG